ncbi:ATP-binding cassette domain-containing protein [Bifidobacterium tissieri]|uniref:ATP-binding cassette domain-containing protein n=1 Tax=Bifidobacterium tissieri TaxID=1630162 RepID=A0A5M9ZST4_9BIFI|nr:ATP-binding cassette domain-containing protein [Bifidobacterium tissieri]KAA8828270.1 ATP-binding cassette domain-containing protein [Bifidobacterium tissieri]KAA8830373.1 ATP-binding cassette domain-containing protein [Bifidobacterium tissieri]
MFDKRLFSIVPGVGRLVAGKAALLWVTLMANVAFAVTLVLFLSDLLTAADPHRPVPASCQIDPNGGCAPAPGLADLHIGMTPSEAVPYIIAFVIIAAIRYAATRGATHLGFLAAEKVKLALRQKMIRKMHALGPAYSTTVRTSNVVQLAGEGVEQVQTFFDLFLPQLFYSVLAPITLFVVLLPVNLPAAITLLVCAPLIVLIVGLVAMSAARVFKKYWGKYTDLGATFLDDLQGLETLKNFDADERAHRTMNTRAEEFRVMTMKVLQIQLRSLSVMDLVAYGGAAAGIGVALWQYTTYGVSLSGVLLIVLLSADFFIPLRQLGSYFHVAMNGMTSSRKILDLLDTPEPDHGSAVMPTNAVTVRFDGVGFRYDDDTEALHNVSFTARPGELTAVVGVSGSGKSTAAGLIAGRLTGYTGSIALRGVGSGKDDDASVELRDASLDSLLAGVTIVSATSHLFHDTLRNNLLMAAPDATDDDLWHALELARVADFVREQSDGLDMRIDEGASNLSGGQKQRIALARGLLHDSAITVFDEATSNVDAESERLILDAIHDLAASGKTVIMITHRMANAVDANHVVVFDHGTVVETGTHAELMTAAGEYERLFRTQSAVENLGDRGSVAVQDANFTHVDGDAADVDNAASVDPVQTSSPSPNGTTMSTMGLIRRLLGQARPLAGFMTAAVVCGVIGHLAATLLPTFGVIGLFALAGHPVWGIGVVPAAIGLAVCAVVRGAMRYVEQFMNHNVAFRLLALFRDKAFGALRRLAPAKLAGHGKGDLVALITTDVELLEIFFAHTISPVVIAVVTSIVFAALLAGLNPWFALLLIVAHLTVGVALPRLFAARVTPLGAQIRKTSAELDDYVLDGMRGMDETIRFNQGERRVASITERTMALWNRRGRLSRANGVFAGLGGVLVELFTVIAAAIALSLAFADSLSVPNSIVAITLISSSFGPTLALSALPASLTQTFASARRLFALMDEAPAVEERGTATPDYTGMTLDNVTFAYPGTATPILTDASLDVPRTGVLGVQGRSGAGKSTMLKLLMRYWDPNTGTVRMSGTDLRDVDAHHRRRVQTMLAQETYLFDGTIRENLLLADPNASEEALAEACRRASVTDLIDSLPDGLDTAVGELGDRLSEGERQRIGLARVFLRRADLVLFDEPTSRLDALNEAVILRSIDTLATADGPAVMLVSHRESAMRIADRVLQVGSAAATEATETVEAAETTDRSPRE